MTLYTNYTDTVPFFAILSSDYLLYPTSFDKIDTQSISTRLNSNEIVINCSKTAEELLKSILHTAAVYEGKMEVYLFYPLSIYRDTEQKVRITSLIKTLSKVCKTPNEALTLWAHMRSYEFTFSKGFRFTSGTSVMKVFANGSIVLKKDGNISRMKASHPTTYAKLLDLLSKR